MNYLTGRELMNIEDSTDGADGQPRCAVSTGYLALAADVWISPCNMIPLYVERTPGNFDRWHGPTGRYVGEFAYPIYRKAEPDNTKMSHGSAAKTNHS